MDNYIYILDGDDFMIVKGAGVKLIEKELKSTYKAKWQPVPFNMWLLHNMNKEQFLKNPNILSKISTFNVEQPYINIFDTIPLPDIIEILAKVIDERTFVSLLCVNKELNKNSNKYTTIIHKYAVKRELKHINKRARVYYKENILDIAMGDRVIVNNCNYKVKTITGKKAMIEPVNLYGNSIISKWSEIAITKYRDSNSNYSTYNWRFENKLVKPGVVQYDYGPPIYTSDDHYLKYKTVPYTQKGCLPQIGVMVTVEIDIDPYDEMVDIDALPVNVREYAITELSTDKMTLSYVGNFPFIAKDGINVGIKHTLYATLQNNEWTIDCPFYTIDKIGGFRELATLFTENGLCVAM